MICTPLLFDISADGSFVAVFSYGTGKVSICPEFSTPKLLLYVGTPFEYFPGGNALDDRYRSGHTVGWNALHEKMHMIVVGTYLQKFHLISFLNFYTYLLQYIVYICVKHRSSVLRWKYEMVEKHGNIMALMNIFAHLYILRRKRQGIQPGGI